MAGRPLGRKNLRSFLAADEIRRLQLNPIEQALNAIQQLDELIEMNITAYKSGRGLSDRGDSGPQYLSNAIRATSDKKDTYMVLAKFIYPTLSAIAIQDIDQGDNLKKPMTTAEAVNILKNDAFLSQNITSEEVVMAMETPRDITVLSKGIEDEIK